MTSISLRGAVQEALRDGHPERAFDRLAELLLSPVVRLREKWEARCLLALVVQKVSGAAATALRREQAGRCGFQLLPIRSFVGRAEFPVVGGRVRRFVLARISEASVAEDVVPADLSQATASAITDALEAARNLVNEVDRKYLRVDLEETNGPIQGKSLGLAVGVAALSYLQRIELPESAVFTGELRPDGRIESISYLAEKLALLHECRPAAVLVLPADNHSEDPSVCHVASMREVLAKLGLDSNRDLGAELTQVASDYHRGRWLEAARRAQLLLAEPGLRSEEQLKLRTILLAAANHQGDMAQAAAVMQELRHLLVEKSCSLQTIALALANAAVHCIDLLRAGEAQALLSEAEQLPLPDQDPCWVHLYGTKARVNILRGDFQGALGLRLRNIQACPDDERPRCLGDLADSYLRLERWNEAAQSLQAAQQALAELRSQRRRIDYLRATEQHLRLCEVRLLRARGDLVGARSCLMSATRGTSLPIPELLRIEEALLAESTAARFAALDAVFTAIAKPDSTIFRALALRARIFAGDSAAELELATLFGLPGESAAELCRRLPY